MGRCDKCGHEIESTAHVCPVPTHINTPLLDELEKGPWPSFVNAEPTSELVQLRTRITELEEERDRYLNTFKHTHVAGRDGRIDRCHECGLDIRDAIHIRNALEDK